MPDRRLLALVVLGATACADRYQPAAADLEPPQVLATEPAAGSGDAGRLPEVRITFSEPIDPASITAASFRLLGPDGPVAGERRVEGAEVVFTPSTVLREGASYRVVIGRQVRDLAGVPLAGSGGVESDFSYLFGTAAVPPTVVSIEPADGADGVAYDPAAPVVVRFSEPMDPATVDVRTFTVRDEALLVEGRIACDESCTALTFTPKAPWREGRVHRVEIAAAAADVSGIPMAASVAASFTTAADAPLLSPVQPLQDATGVGVAGLDVVVQADERLEPGSVGAWNVAVEPPADFRVDWNEATRQIVVAFAEELVSNVTYRITFGTGIADDDGHRMAAPFVLAFTTAGTPDNNPPGPIVDLGATSSRRARLTLRFTAPGDDTEGGVAKGVAAGYELRRSLSPIADFGAFDRAEAIGPVLVPQAAGATESVELEVGLEEPFHYAVVAVDDGGNSILSGDRLASASLQATVARGTPADRLGAALVVADLDGDGAMELVAGAPGADEVRIYAAAGDLAQPLAVLTGPAGAGFGSSLAAGDLDGDGAAELLVGGPLHDGERGGAWLFRGGPLANGDATAAAAAIAGTVIRDRLGTAVAIGDATGDGVADAIVGAPGDGTLNEGAVFVMPAGVDGFADPQIRRGGLPGDRYGAALAVGDLDGDGRADLAVGAPGADPAGSIDAGQVVIHGAGGDVVLAGAQARSLFGAALAVGDANGDGTTDLLVGAPFHDADAAADAGAAQLFAGPLGAGAQPAFAATGQEADEHFGHAVVITGPLLDGTVGGLAIGAPAGRNRGGVIHGAVHLIHAGADGSFTANGVRYGPEAFDDFGAAVAAAGDLDGDGLHDFAASTPHADGAGSAAGAIHLLR
ncbi:Ig-like domain-containing protein [Vulgatibacter sp.]|uniref:Ig-like domain-containing protein n=1 Tax=Vulgatibacter sp. TaxID=1971226 RepID=UPI003569EADE